MIAGVKIENVSRDPDYATFKGDLTYTCWDLIYSTCVRNLTTLAAAIPEIWLVPTEIEMVHVTLTTPLSGVLCHPWASTCSYSILAFHSNYVANLHYF